MLEQEREQLQKEKGVNKLDIDLQFEFDHQTDRQTQEDKQETTQQEEEEEEEEEESSEEEEEEEKPRPARGRPRGRPRGSVTGFDSGRRKAAVAASMRSAAASRGTVRGRGGKARGSKGKQMPVMPPEEGVYLIISLSLILKWLSVASFKISLHLIFSCCALCEKIRTKSGSSRLFLRKKYVIATSLWYFLCYCYQSVILSVLLLLDCDTLLCYCYQSVIICWYFKLCFCYANWVSKYRWSSIIPYPILRWCPLLRTHFFVSDETRFEIRLASYCIF